MMLANTNWNHLWNAHTLRALILKKKHQPFAEVGGVSTFIIASHSY